MIGIVQKMNSVPGLSVVGGAGDDRALKKIGEDALKAADRIMQDQGAMNNFLNNQATIINNMLEKGAEVDEAFVDEILGCNLRPIEPKIQRETSYSQNEDCEGRMKATSKQLSMSLKEQPEKRKAGDFLVEDAKDGKKGKKDAFGPSSQWASKWNVDELNLSGLLNVLDGVVDSPGR